MSEAGDDPNHLQANQGLVVIGKGKNGLADFLKTWTDKVMTVRDQRRNCQERSMLGRFRGHGGGNQIALDGWLFRQASPDQCVNLTKERCQWRMPAIDNNAEKLRKRVDGARPDNALRIANGLENVIKKFVRAINRGMEGSREMNGKLFQGQASGESVVARKQSK